MKILLTNYSLKDRGGSETWTMTMYDHLKKNHDVDVYVSRSGVNRLIFATADKNKHYDLALINHNTCLKELLDWNISKRIFTSHGVIPELEKMKPGADYYVAVSEEVQKKFQEFNPEVIRNPIDTDYFLPTKINKSLKNILYLNNHAKINPWTPKIIKVCRHFNFRIVADHQPTTIKNIEWADLVLSVGRGCYESLSCGKNVLVINKTFDGMVTHENIFELRKNNCSGRRFNLEWDSETLKAELKKYNPDRNMRDYILKNNNIKIIAKEYLKKEQGA